MIFSEESSFRSGTWISMIDQKTCKEMQNNEKFHRKSINQSSEQSISQQLTHPSINQSSDIRHAVSISQSIMVNLLNTFGFSRWFPLRSKKKDSTKEEKYRGEIQVRLNFYVQNLAVSVPNLLENGGKKERSGSFRSTLSKTFGMFLFVFPFFS